MTVAQAHQRWGGMAPGCGTQDSAGLAPVFSSVGVDAHPREEALSRPPGNPAVYRGPGGVRFMPPSTGATPPPSVAALEYVLDATHFAGNLASTIATALEASSSVCGVAWQAVVGHRSLSAIRRARHAVAAALFAIDVGEGRHLSLEEIGLIMGGKDHTTVRYYLDRVRQTVAS